MDVELVEAKTKFLLLIAFLPIVGKLLAILAPIVQALL
jgi:membrane protein YqaA with SNARE-associated domain